MKVKRKNQTVKVKYPAGEGYYPDVVGKTALKVKDQGNGYLIEFKAFGSTYLPKMFSLDYAEAECLYLALQEFMKEEQTEVKEKPDEGWIEWYGAASGLRKWDWNDEVEVKCRDGTVTRGLAQMFDWSHEPNFESISDIIAYREVKNAGV